MQARPTSTPKKVTPVKGFPLPPTVTTRTTPTTKTKPDGLGSSNSK
jgi:hypothetical protein